MDGLPSMAAWLGLRCTTAQMHFPSLVTSHTTLWLSLTLSFYGLDKGTRHLRETQPNSELCQEANGESSNAKRQQQAEAPWPCPLRLESKCHSPGRAARGLQPHSRPDGASWHQNSSAHGERRREPAYLLYSGAVKAEDVVSSKSCRTSSSPLLTIVETFRVMCVSILCSEMYTTG